MTVDHDIALRKNKKGIKKNYPRLLINCLIEEENKDEEEKKQKREHQKSVTDSFVFLSFSLSFRARF